MAGPIRPVRTAISAARIRQRTVTTSGFAIAIIPVCPLTFAAWQVRRATGITMPLIWRTIVAVVAVVVVVVVVVVVIVMPISVRDTIVHYVMMVVPMTPRPARTIHIVMPPVAIHVKP